MGLLYDFTDLIHKYSVEGKLIQESGKGEYIGGNWIPAPASEPKMIKGALLPMTKQKIYQSGGTYTENDRELIISVYIIWTHTNTHGQAHKYDIFSKACSVMGGEISLILCQKLYYFVSKKKACLTR